MSAGPGESEVICQFRRGHEATRRRRHRRAHRPGRDPHYTIQTPLTQSGSGDLSFAADARLRDHHATPRWVPGWRSPLFEKLKVDSARWESGEPATVFKGKDGPLLWVRLDGPLQAGDARTLNLFYHGDLIDRYGDFFFIKSSAGVVPPLTGRQEPGDLRPDVPQPEGKAAGQCGRPDRSKHHRPDDHLPLGDPGPDPQCVVQSRHLQGLPDPGGGDSAGHRADFRGRSPASGGRPAAEEHEGDGRRRRGQEHPILPARVRSRSRPSSSSRPRSPFHGEAFPGLVHLSSWTFHQTDQQGRTRCSGPMRWPTSGGASGWISPAITTSG